MITIIVLLILAAVTLNLALGERGIFKTASDAKIKTERAEIIEKAKLDIVDVQTGNMGKFTESELIEILNKYGALSDNGEETIIDKTLTSKDGKHEIKVSEIWDEEFTKDLVLNTVKFSINTEELSEENKPNLYLSNWGDGNFEVAEGTTWEKFLGEKGFLTNSFEGFSVHDYVACIFMLQYSSTAGYRGYLLMKDDENAVQISEEINTHSEYKLKWFQSWF